MFGIEIKPLEIIIALIVVAGLIGGIFYAGYSAGTNSEKQVSARALSDQKTADQKQCESSQQTAGVIGNDYQNSLIKRDSDYDGFVQRNVACTGRNETTSRVITDAATGDKKLLPVGGIVVNAAGYAKLLRSAQGDNNKVIGLQACVRAGCVYSETDIK